MLFSVTPLAIALHTALFSLPTDRRSVLSSLILTPAVDLDRIENVVRIASDEIVTSPERTKSLQPWSIQLPLERYSGGTNCIRLTLSYRRIESLFGAKRYLPKKVYKAIVDTGSPYLVISDGMEYASFLDEVENPVSWKMPPTIDFIYTLFEPNVHFELEKSSYGPTEEIYGSVKGNIEWKESFVQVRDENVSDNIVLGVLDEKLTQESGGPLIGLVKRSNHRTEKVQLRPTFLEQLRYREICSFQIDSPNKLLTLASGKSLINDTAEKIIPLVDLRPLGDFVEHYTCIVDTLKLNNDIFTAKSISSNGLVRPIVAVFDSGLSGCLLTQPLWDLLVDRQNIDLTSVNNLDVGVITKASNSNAKESLQKKHLVHFETDSTMPFFRLSPISLDWFDDDDDTCPLVVVLGQTFLSQGSLTIDIDERQATFKS